MARKAPFIGKVVTDTQWDMLKTEFVRTDITIANLALKYGLSQASVYKKRKDEDWNRERADWRVSICAQSGEIIRQRQVEDHVRLYDATRRTVDLLVAQAERFAQDPEALFRHLVQYEKTEQVGQCRDTEKYVEDKIFPMINGKNFADIGKALKDVSIVARTLDGILDARDRANIDLQREKLELDRKTRGMDDDTQAESGIAYIPARDASLLEGALDDPGEALETSEGVK